MKALWAICLMAVFVPCLARAQQPVSLDAGERKRLDTFFSNFAEVNLPDFVKNGLGDQAMLDFALWHCVMNAPKSFKTTKDGNAIVIPSEAVDKVTQRYFGQVVPRHAKASYTADLATGDAFVFAQVKTLSRLDDGTYLATGTIYATGSGGTPDPHGTPAAWAKAGENVRAQGTFSGRVQKVAGEKERYILIEYSVREKQGK